MSILSKDYIIINGVKSDEVGLYIDTPPMPSMSAPLFDTIQIPGRAEQITIKKEEREDVEVVISAYLFDDSAYNPNQIYEYIYNAKTLRISKNADYEYRVNRVTNLVPTYKGHGKQFLSITFICSPFRYAVSNSTQTYRTTDIVLENKGSYYAQPIITVHNPDEDTGVSSVIKIIINNDTENEFGIYWVKDTVTIDCERLIAYDSEGKFVGTKGKFPFIPTGNVLITTNSDLTKIKMNERWI